MYLHALRGWRPLEMQASATYGCMAAGHSPSLWAWTVA